MAELEKVINGLTCCINHNDCKKCPYANEYDTTFDCIDRTRKDALELLNKYAKVIDKLEQVRLSENLRMYVDEILDELYDSD